MKKFIISVVSLALLFVLQIGLTCVTLTSLAKRSAVDSAKYCSDTISVKVDETINLLTSLADTKLISGDSLTYREKAVALTKVSQQFGYMMIRILDENLIVYSENSDREDAQSSDLSSRDYLQKVKRTLTFQVTDVFRAGADGKTRNYTVAVPIVVDGTFKGALFAAIYETTFAELLKSNNSKLIGSSMQYMSGIDDDELGMTLDDVFEDAFFFVSNKEKRMTEIMNSEKLEGSFIGLSGFEMTIYAYNKVENTKWNVIASVTWQQIIASNPVAFIMMAFSIATTGFLLVMTVYNKKKSDNSKEDEEIDLSNVF